MAIGGIVLAGGRSRRMGLAKATLPLGDETLLGRIVRIVSEAASPVVVVGAIDQELPPLPSGVIIGRDRQSGRGPLEGIAAGLRAASGVESVYITACDTPLLKSSFILRVAGLLDADHDAAIPVIDDLPQPLAGVYRASILDSVDQMLAQNQLRLLDLVERLRVRRIGPSELSDVDPQLDSLRNLNTQADYEAAL